jgi:hypothetical protein
MHGFRRKLIAAGAAMLLSTLGLATSAGASSAPSAAKVPVVKLSAADQQALQAKVDAFLNSSVGGRQTGPNTIEFDGGKVILTVPLPGERQARAINEPIGTLGTANCSYLWACLYDGTNFDGARLALTNCGLYALSGYGFANITSSIHNNQSSGTQTYILNSSSQILNANLAPSRVNDVGVGGANRAVYWRVC